MKSRTSVKTQTHEYQGKNTSYDPPTISSGWVLRLNASYQHITYIYKPIYDQFNLKTSIIITNKLPQIIADQNILVWKKLLAFNFFFSAALQV